jgi:hypothetical protein
VSCSRRSVDLSLFVGDANNEECDLDRGYGIVVFVVVFVLVDSSTLCDLPLHLDLNRPSPPLNLLLPLDRTAPRPLILDIHIRLHFDLGLNFDLPRRPPTPLSNPNLHLDIDLHLDL